LTDGGQTSTFLLIPTSGADKNVAKLFLACSLMISKIHGMDEIYRVSAKQLTYDLQLGALQIGTY
jgi:hypothetical protein